MTGASVAVAIGFKMNLFNIGVDGQYRLAAFLAAAVGGAAFMTSLPGPLRIVVTIVVAMMVGAAWAGVAALLKATRGVSEVISTIMLNAIATYIIAFLLKPTRLGVAEGNNISTAKVVGGGYCRPSRSACRVRHRCTRWCSRPWWWASCTHWCCPARCSGSRRGPLG